MSQTFSLFGDLLYIGKIHDPKSIKNIFRQYYNKTEYFSTPEGWGSPLKTTLYSDDAIRDLPWKILFKEILDDHLIPFLNSLNPNSSNIDISYEPWLNLYDTFHCQEYHNHLAKNNHFSCAYMLEIPENSGEIKFVSRADNFYAQTGLNRMFDLPFDIEKYKPPQEEGTILIFPSYLPHLVTPNLSSDLRATISANFCVSIKKISMQGP